MRVDVENPMILDSHWRHLEKEQKIIGECAGCHEDIVEGEDILVCNEFPNEEVLIHQDNECVYQFVAGMSRCEVAGA
jgi:hypothetical protein